MLESWEEEEEEEGRVNVRLVVHEGWGHAAWLAGGGWLSECAHACVRACVCLCNYWLDNWE